MAEGTTLRRRGLIAAVAAMVAGIAMKQTSEPVAAASLTIDSDNPSAGNTNIHGVGAKPTWNASGVFYYAVLSANNTSTAGGSTGIAAYGDFTGVAANGNQYGLSASADTGILVDGATTGVQASSNGATGYGVHGYNGVGGTGIFGEAFNGIGTLGQSDSGTAVQGQVLATTHFGGANTAANTVAVKGVNRSTGAGGFGVYGSSARSFGGWFESGSDQGTGGVVGVARSAGTVGFQALAVSPATTAGFFSGNVSVIGSLGVTGGKFAVVKGVDNQYRGMYAVESPECWFEDFGTGTLVNGVASVKLDPLFAQHVHTDTYHVFISPHDAEHQLTATMRSGQGFTVSVDVTLAKLKGKQLTDLNGTFSYRVVAKRNDIKGERMPVWQMPAGIPIPDPPTVEPARLPPASSAQPPRVLPPQPAPSPVPPVAASSPVALPAAPAPNPLPPSRP